MKRQICIGIFVGLIIGSLSSLVYDSWSKSRNEAVAGRIARMSTNEAQLAARRPYWEARTNNIQNTQISESWKTEEVHFCMDAPSEAITKYASQTYSDEIGALCQLAITRLMELDPKEAIQIANKFNSFIIAHDLWLGIGKSAEKMGMEEMKRLWNNENAVQGKGALAIAWVESSPDATWSILSESVRDGTVSTTELRLIWAQHARRDLPSAVKHLGALPDTTESQRLWKSAWLGMANDKLQLNQAAIEVAKWTNAKAAEIALDTISKRLEN